MPKAILLIVTGLLLSMFYSSPTAAQTDLAYSQADYRIVKKMGQPFYSGEVLPRPQKYKYHNNNVLIVDGEKFSDFYDIRFECSFPSAKLAELLFKKRISAFRKAFKTEKWTIAENAEIIPIIFAQENSPEAVAALKLCDKENKKLNLKTQGYMLSITPKAIICIVADNIGLINGMASLLQLIHVENSKLVVRCADIKDWPVFQYRYVSEYHFPSDEFFEWLATYKINGFTSAYCVIPWIGLTSQNVKDLSRLKAFIDKYQTLYYMAQIHIGGRGNLPKLDCGSEEQIKKLLNVVAELVNKYQVKHIMLCNDDVPSKLTLPEEKGKFKSPGEAHGYVVDRVYKHIKKLNPDVELSFCTTYYRGRRWRNWQKDNPNYNDSIAYMADVRKWNPNVGIVWTGPVTESRLIVNEDIKHYKNMIGRKRPLLYYDNTWHYHQPVRNFHAKYPKNFVDSCMDKIAYININANLPIGRFFIATVSDYYWNPDGFNSILSRDHAVVQFMGAKALPTVKELYKLRGEDYVSRFMKKVNLDKFEQILEKLEKTNLDPGLMRTCWYWFNKTADTQKQPQRKHKL